MSLDDLKGLVLQLWQEKVVLRAEIRGLREENAWQSIDEERRLAVEAWISVDDTGARHRARIGHAFFGAETR